MSNQFQKDFMDWLINDFKNSDYAQNLPYIFSIENIKFPNGYLTQSTQYGYSTTPSGGADSSWLPTSFTVCDPNTISSVTTGADWLYPYGGRWRTPLPSGGSKYNPTNGAAFSKYKDTVATCFDKRGGTRVHRVYYADNGGDPVPSILFVDENNEIGYKNLSYSNGILSTPEGNSDSWNLIMETVDPELLNLFATTSEKGNEYLNSACLNTQNTTNPEFASNERCGRGNNKYQTTTPFMSVDMAGIPTEFCTTNISTICDNSGSDFCACYSNTSEISPQTQNLIDANKDLFPDGVCKPGEIKDTCIPRVCVEPRCMSGKAYKSAEELRYKCPKFCSGLVNATVGENGTVNYTNSNIEVDCGQKSVYIPKQGENISPQEVVSTSPSVNKNVEKIGLISGIAVISVIIVILIILILKKKL